MSKDLPTYLHQPTYLFQLTYLPTHIGLLIYLPIYPPILNLLTYPPIFILNISKIINVATWAQNYLSTSMNQRLLWLR
jgi:hypothetical protein